MKRISVIAWVPRYPLIALLVSTIFFGFFVSYARYAQQINNVDYFSVENDDTRYFAEFKKIFPKSEFFAITFQKKEIFEQLNLEVLRDITNKLLALPEVLDVKSLANVDYTEGEQDSFTVRKFLEKISNDPEKLQLLKKQALARELYVPNLISKDSSAASIVVFVKENNKDDTYRKMLLEKVDSILDQYKDKVDRFYTAGWTVTNYSLSRILQHDLRTFLPLTYLLIAVSVYLIFRNVTLVILAVVNLSACLLSMIGLFGLTGITINNLTAITLPLGVTLSLADTIHVFSHLDIQLVNKYKSHRKALSHVLSSVIKPCFFTSLTTAIGFASLAVSSIIAMKDFAVIASLTMMFEFFYSFFLLPAIIALLPARFTFGAYDSEGDGKFINFLRTWYNFLLRRYVAVILSTVTFAILGFYFLLKVPVETNVIKYFKESSPLRQDLKVVEKLVGGVASFDVSLSAPEADAFKSPAALLYIDKLSDFIKSQPGVDSVTALSDFFKDMNRSFHGEAQEFYKVPDNISQVEQYLLLYDGKDLDNVVNSKFNESKISVRISLHSTKDEKILLDQIRSYLTANAPPPPITARLIGFAVNYTNVAAEMVDGQLSSFATATITIGILMSLLLGSVSLGILSLVPNIYPIFLTFGLMGLVGIPLDTGTVMIASVVLGIACDDTVHFLYSYGEKVKKGTKRIDALEEVFMHKGRAIFSTALILSLGFVALIFGSFVPIIHFGVLCTFTMIVAIAGDLLLLPALLIWNSKIREA